ncbi:MAG TPA: SURF1 family protein [Steroidobacteraceae bacterium]|nr:SURF1 family protein [Steroidobacteraceae bacterium]
MPLTVEIGQFRWSASWFMTLLTAAGVVVFILLGRWQWHRAAEKRLLYAQFAAGTASPVDLGERSLASLARYAQVRLRGRYDGAHQFLLDNMSVGEQSGYEVLTPLILSDGRTVMVNRGWVPIGASRRAPPDVQLSSAAVESVVGRIDNLPVVGISLGHIAPAPGAPWPELTSFPTTADLSAALGRPLQSRQLLLNADQPLGYTRDWHPSGFGPDRYLSYAIQWWCFAALALILYGALNRRKSA